MDFSAEFGVAYLKDGNQMGGGDFSQTNKNLHFHVPEANPLSILCPVKLSLSSDQEYDIFKSTWICYKENNFLILFQCSNHLFLILSLHSHHDQF